MHGNLTTRTRVSITISAMFKKKEKIFLYSDKVLLIFQSVLGLVGHVYLIGTNKYLNTHLLDLYTRHKSCQKHIDSFCWYFGKDKYAIEVSNNNRTSLHSLI